MKRDKAFIIKAAMELLINSEGSLEAAINELIEQFNEKKYVKVKLSYGRQRTLTQNAALHKYCEMLASALNDAGYDMKRTIKQDVDIPWNQASAKQFLWRPIQKAVTGLDSTTKPEASQYSAIYEVLNRHMSQKFGVSVSWPQRENQND